MKRMIGVMLAVALADGGSKWLAARLLGNNCVALGWFMELRVTHNTGMALGIFHENRLAALLDVHILTGRTHQIRVHMQSLHHPVAGDPIYGQKNGVRAPRLMLHAYTLAFDHPVTGERLRFTAPPPEAFTQAVRKWQVNPAAPLPYQTD